MSYAAGFGVDQLVRSVLKDQLSFSPRFGVSDAPSIQSEYERRYQLNASSFGRQLINLVGDENIALRIASEISVDIIFELHMMDNPIWNYTSGEINKTRSRRALSVPATDDLPPALLLLDANIHDVALSQRLTDNIQTADDKLERIAIIALQAMSKMDMWHGVLEDRVLSFILSSGAGAMEELIYACKPEVISSRMPNMVPLCTPASCLSISANDQVSTAGIFCFDKDGEFGVTGCYHGTGPIGTPVTVGLKRSQVKLASETQDLVFIPLGRHHNIPGLRGENGLRERPPAQSDAMRFEGATSGQVQTVVCSHDAGLNRRRPTLQLKVQTRADTNFGDSGCALIDEDDRIVGFAFEQTAYGEYPAFTDWIWAANALAALNLRPITTYL